MMILYQMSVPDDMLKLAYTAISSVEGGWDFLKTYTPAHGFMYSIPPPKLQEINIAISKSYEGHSGASYAITMRNMEYIAKNGCEAYCKKKAAECSSLEHRFDTRSLQK